MRFWTQSRNSKIGEIINAKKGTSDTAGFNVAIRQNQRLFALRTDLQAKSDARTAMLSPRTLSRSSKTPRAAKPGRIRRR